MKKRETIYKEILSFISERDNFLITTHLSADGDAYSAVLAIAYLLEEWDKSYEIVIHDQKKEEKYQYLWGWEKILSYQKGWPANYDAGIVLDVPSTNRIGDPAVLLPDPQDCIKIDHHPHEEDFSVHNLVDTEVSSTCHLAYEVISRSGISFTNDLANLLFSGIMYDTGRFSFSNTGQRDFEIAAELVPYGVKPNEIANHLFFSNTFHSLKVIGYGLANMETHLNGKVCIIYLPLNVIQEHDELDIDELANYSLALRGVEVGLFIRGAEPDFIKISFRSKGRVDVNNVARVFGGGGHLHAAGCRTSANYDELKERLLNEIEKQL